MTCEEWRNGYKQGFEDGYEKAKRDLCKSTTNLFYPSQPNMLDNRDNYTYKPTHLSPSSFDNGHDGDIGC